MLSSAPKHGQHAEEIQSQREWPSHRARIFRRICVSRSASASGVGSIWRGGRTSSSSERNRRLQSWRRVRGNHPRRGEGEGAVCLGSQEAGEHAPSSPG
jgi:hypothetical protein